MTLLVHKTLIEDREAAKNSGFTADFIYRGQKNN